MLRRLLPFAALALAACSATNPGGGSRTLYVSARLSSDGSTPGTRARVTVREGTANGALVSNAQVTLRGGALGTVTLPWEGNNEQYRLEGFAWDEAFGLKVERGQDVLEASLEAPGLSTIVEPIADTTFRIAAGQPLLVRWKDSLGRRAMRTRVELDKAGLDVTLVEGGFDTLVEANRLKVEDKERVRLERTNEVGLAGGTAGSVLSAATTHEIDFRVE